MERLVPTESHVLWGGAVEIHCFGTRHGNWSLAGANPEEAEAKNPGIIGRMQRLSDRHGCSIHAPNPSAFNGEIVWPHDLRDHWIPFALHRGAHADGVALTDPNHAFAVSSGDCPTVVLRDSESGDVVAAHAGRDSLIKEDGGLVKRMCETIRGPRDGMRGVRAFIACGIGYDHFTHPWNDPVHGERNRRLHAFASEYEGAAFRGDEEGKIHLPLLIAGQLIERNVADTRIGSDCADTYSDLGPDGKPLWHSHRRGDRTRNLVLVIRRW